MHVCVGGSLMADIEAAVAAPYGASGDYMWHLAKVHKQVRGW
jgi:hypothetical protein